MPPRQYRSGQYNTTHSMNHAARPFTYLLRMRVVSPGGRSGPRLTILRAHVLRFELACVVRLELFLFALSRSWQHVTRAFALATVTHSGRSALRFGVAESLLGHERCFQLLVRGHHQARLGRLAPRLTGRHLWWAAAARRE